MILYTPLAPEAIFPPDENAWHKQQTKAIDHGCVTLQQNEEGGWMIAALHSSNPHDYLNPHLQPGIKWQESE